MTGRPARPWPEQWCGTDCGPGELQKIVKISVDSGAAAVQEIKYPQKHTDHEMEKGRELGKQKEMMGLSSNTSFPWSCPHKIPILGTLSQRTLGERRHPHGVN